MQSDWLRTFWPISQEPEFSQIWDLCRNTANNINFHYRTNSVKINDKIFQYFQKKTCFWSIFGPFSQFLKKFFSRKSGSVKHNFIWVCSIMPKFRKNYWFNSKKTPRQTEGQKDGQEGQTLFYRILLATAGGPEMVNMYF